MEQRKHVFINIWTTAFRLESIRISVREYVYYVFFRLKKMTFYVF